MAREVVQGVWCEGACQSFQEKCPAGWLQLAVGGTAPQKRGKDGYTDQRGDQTGGNLQGGEQAASSEVGQPDDQRPGDRRQRQMQPGARAGQTGGHMRGDQADEAERANRRR